MCEAMNITVKVTAAESPFSNGLVERHNMIIANMLDKILEDQQLDLDIALSWCLNAKSLLANFHGFSPFQLVFGQNPKLLSISNGRPPAFTPLLYRAIVGQLNWVAGISRPDISFAVCEPSTKFTDATVADIIYVNKIIRKVKSSYCFIQFPKLDLNSVKLQLFTDVSFNNLPNGGSQAEQIIF